MNKPQVSGKLLIEGSKHNIVYELDTQTGGKTAFLSSCNDSIYIPIFVSQIDEVIEMLRMVKRATEALEPED